MRCVLCFKKHSLTGHQPGRFQLRSTCTGNKSQRAEATLCQHVHALYVNTSQLADRNKGTTIVCIGQMTFWFLINHAPAGSSRSQAAGQHGRRWWSTESCPTLKNIHTETLLVRYVRVARSIRPLHINLAKFSQVEHILFTTPSQLFFFFFELFFSKHTQHMLSQI